MTRPDNIKSSFDAVVPPPKKRGDAFDRTAVEYSRMMATGAEYAITKGNDVLGALSHLTSTLHTHAPRPSLAMLPPWMKPAAQVIGSGLDMATTHVDTGTRTRYGAGAESLAYAGMNSVEPPLMSVGDVILKQTLGVAPVDQTMRLVATQIGRGVDQVNAPLPAPQTPTTELSLNVPVRRMHEAIQPASPADTPPVPWSHHGFAMPHIPPMDTSSQQRHEIVRQLAQKAVNAGPHTVLAAALRQIHSLS